MDMLPKTTRQVLKAARDTYGEKNQILVAIEELNELACVCAKFPRYESKDKAVDELREKVIDELADVCIVMDHIQAIFGVTDTDIWERAMKKGERVSRWLKTSKSMEQTTRDRKV